MRIRAAVLAGLAVLLVAGPVRAAAPLAPLVVGWENYFKIQSEIVEEYGRPIIRGYVLNDWGFVARRVQLLVESLDQNGTILGQRVEWLVPSVLTPGSRAYFETPAPAFSLAYRVSVFSFDWQVDRPDRFPW